MSDKPKILHLISKFDYSQGGPPRMVSSTAKIQKYLGYKVKILTTSDKYIGETNKIYFGKLLLNRFAIPNFSLLIKIYKEIKKHDIIHIHNFWNIFVTISIIFSKIQKKKIILSPHGSLHKENIKKNYLLKLIFFKLVEKKNLTFIYKFHFLNPNEKKNFYCKKILNKKNFMIIPNSIEKVYRKKKNIKKFKTNEFNFSYIGRISKNKGISLMISSYLECKKKYPNISLHIIGPNSNYKKFLINTLKFGSKKNNIFFHKPIYNYSRFNIMENSTAVILLSDLECDSVLSKEVWSSKGLLITTKNSFNENYFEKKIALIVKKNTRSVSEAMIKSILNRKSLDKIRENGYIYSLTRLNIVENTKKLTKSYLSTNEKVYK
tara:strand:+ start:7450 stop:8580 length:1131 start_codon:yes stop_codon:yes gene_type:complete